MSFRTSLGRLFSSALRTKSGRNILKETTETTPVGIDLSSRIVPLSKNSSIAEEAPKHDITHFIKGGTPCDPAAPPFQLSMYGEKSVYTLVLLRHGESEWNKENRYTGWCDVNLTPRGKKEARDAGRLLKENGVEIDHCFTSVLRRAGVTANMALSASDQFWVPITKTWRLNERHYGSLQGYNKDTAYEELGIDQELVMEMRMSYDTRPPPMSDDHPHWHGKDRRYKLLSKDKLELTRAESLHDTANRILPFYNSVIVPSLVSGNTCLVVSHANTIRSLIKHIDNISDEDIKSMSIPTGVPLLYRFDKDMKPVDPNVELEFRYMVEPKGYTWATSHQYGFHGVYLGDLERLQEIQRQRDVASRDWQRVILRNLAKSILLSHVKNGDSPVVETYQLYLQICNKMQHQEFSNMLLLRRMKDEIETILCRKMKYLGLDEFEAILAEVHLDAEGQLVEPFECLKSKSQMNVARDFFDF